MLFTILFTSCAIFGESFMLPPKESGVNLFSLENFGEFNNYSFTELKERFYILNDMDGVRDFWFYDWAGTCGFKTSIVNSTSIKIHPNSNDAKNSFRFQKEQYDTRWLYRIKYRVVEISEEIEVILCDSKGLRDEYGWYIGDNLYTYIRIGNITVFFSEYFNRRNTKKNGIPTTNNINMICTVLMQ